MKKFIITIGINSLLFSTLLSSAAFAESHAVKATEHSAGSYSHTAAEKDAPFWSASQAKAAKQESLLIKKIEQDPENKAAHASLANLYLGNNKTKKAIEAYQQAIIVDADNARLFAGISVAYLHQSKYAMAKAMAEQAIKLDPEMKHAIKIKEYITKKEEVIAQAEGKSSSMPTDPVHK